MRLTRLLLTGFAGCLLPGSAAGTFAASCRTDAFGVVSCDREILQQPGYLENPDKAWQKDSFGNVRERNGTTHGKDSFDKLRKGFKAEPKPDVLNGIRGSDGPVCRNDSTGALRCE